jgi:hypothetical protein
MLSDLNHYLINDLCLIVIEYVKFSDKQLALLMNQKVKPSDIYLFGTARWLIKHERIMVLKNIDPDSYSVCSSSVKQDIRFSLATVYYYNKPTMHYLVNNTNFSKKVDITKAIHRLEKECKKPFHLHGSTIVVADDDHTFTVYDFDLDFK